MASTDAKLVPTKNTAYRVTFPILDADGDLVTGATGLDSEVSKDGGTFADCTNEATEIATSSGLYYLDLTATEMNADTVAVIVKTTSSGAKTTVLTFYPQESGDLITNATQIGGAAQTPRDIGASVLLSSGTGTGQVSLSSGAVLLQATQTGVTIPTVTTLTTLPAITSNWLTAAGIATGALTNTKFAAGAIDAAAIASNAFASAKFAADFFTSIITAVWTTAATRVLTAATNLTTALATPTNITAGTITTVSGSVTGSVGSIAAGGLTAASLDATVQARLGIVAYGTAQSATGTTLVLASASAFADDELIGAVVVITGGTTGVGQARVITDSVLSTDTVTVDTWTTTPTGTITYVIFAAAPASATALPAVNVTQFGGAAGTFASGRPEVNTTHVGGTSQTAGNLAALITTVDTVVDSILVDTAEIGTAGAGLTALASAANLATVDTVVDAILVDTAEIGAAGAGLTALATAANLATVDTVVDAIKTKTDSLTFTQAGHVDANIQRINDVTIVGDGSTTPFNV